MTKWCLFVLAFYLNFTHSELGARNAAEVVYYHYRASSHGTDVNRYSLYPNEEKIKQFPRSIAKSEQDLKSLQEYYAKVAVAYETHISLNIQPKAGKFKRELLKKRSKSMQSTGESIFRVKKSPVTHSILTGDEDGNESRVHAMRYYSQTYKSIYDQMSEMKKKAKFYQDMSKASKTLQVGFVGH